MSPVLIAREARLPGCVGNCDQGDKPCTCPDRCGVEMACTAGDDDGEPLTRAEGAALLIVVAASAAISVALVAGLLGWLVG